jgi:hypothetical protein
MRAAATKRLDTRRTLTPDGARIALFIDGFEVLLGEESIAVVSWQQVRTIFAYTRFIGERSNLCLAFVLPDTSRGEEDQVVIHDEVPGWEKVAARLTSEFSSVDVAWLHKASVDRENHVSLAGIVRAYTVNVTQVWPPVAELRPNTSVERTRDR